MLFRSGLASFPCSPSLFLVGQVLFLQPKSFPCRASFILVGQVFSLWDKTCPCSPSPFLVEQVFKNLKRGGQVWAFVLSGAPHKKWVRPYFGPMDMSPLGSPSLISYFILFSCPLHPIWSVAFVQTINWGDGQNNHDGPMFMGATDRHT